MFASPAAVLEKQAYYKVLRKITEASFKQDSPVLSCPQLFIKCRLRICYAPQCLYRLWELICNLLSRHDIFGCTFEDFQTESQSLDTFKEQSSSRLYTAI